MENDIIRMWINQPSTLQPFHHLHGCRVLATHEYDDTWRIYFLQGDVISQQISKLALSPGWPTLDYAPDVRETILTGYRKLPTSVQD